MSFTPEVGGTICSDRQTSGRQIPLRRFIVPFALIKHYVPGSLRRRAMRFTDEQRLGAMHLVQVLLRTRIALVHITPLGGCPSPVGGHQRRRLTLHCRPVFRTKQGRPETEAGRAGGTPCLLPADKPPTGLSFVHQRHARKRITFGDMASEHLVGDACRAAIHRHPGRCAPILRDQQYTNKDQRRLMVGSQQKARNRDFLGG